MGNNDSCIGKGNNLKLKKKFISHILLGLLYSALLIIQVLKLIVVNINLMGLAPYGDPIYEDKIKKLN